MGIGLATRRRVRRGEETRLGTTFSASPANLVAGLVAAALLAALPYVVGGGLRTFIAMDDPLNVSENPVVLRGLTAGGLRWAFTAFHWANWHPLTWLSHMLDVSLFGTAAWGHHLTSVLLHALNTALLSLALARLTGAIRASVFAGALFGAHPLRVESVAWVAERKDVLSGLFFVLVLLAYERYARRGGGWRYLLVAVLLALGLMAKSMLVTVPFVLLLLDFWPLGRARTPASQNGSPWSPAPLGRLLVEKAPLLALSAASGVVSFLAQRESGTVVGLLGLSVGARSAHALIAYVLYLGKTAWPLSLAVYYPHPLEMPAWWQVAGAGLLLVLLSLSALRLVGRHPHFFVGWSWFLGMLVPVIGFVQIGEQALADRYTYLPGVGLSVAVVWGASAAFGMVRRGVAGPTAGAVAVLGLLALASTKQVGRWRDTETLFGHTLAVTSGNWAIRNALGFYLADQGRGEEAAAHLQEAVRLRPYSTHTLFRLGVIFHELGRYDEAVAYYKEALRMEPTFPEAHDNLGMILYEMGLREEAALHLGEARRLRAGRQSREAPAP